MNGKLLRRTEAGWLFLLNKKIVTPDDLPFGHGNGVCESTLRNAKTELMHILCFTIRQIRPKKTEERFSMRI